MKTNILLLFLLCISINVSAQELLDFDYTEDYEVILKQTKDESSKLYVEDLFPRFKKGDKTLTEYEVLALNINYTENDNYWPYQDVDLEREIWRLNEEQNFDIALKKCDTLLQRNPFSLIGNREKAYALSETGKVDESVTFENRFYLAVNSILATGEGTSYESSFFTISPMDGQWIIRLILGKEICSMGSGSDEDGNFHDILGVQIDESEECINLFFNIEPASKRIFGPNGLQVENN